MINEKEVGSASRKDEKKVLWVEKQATNATKER